ncbi:MAG: 2,3-bisphosphoglycerate-independent phosphoglycerate mutase, partial [Clostridia bacterium]|nr:2,3-bisphosphoglycerate-independent phosphoglycerate mutase [Clostridia bacterium]
MKYVLVIGDGMSDDPIRELQDKTPLEYLDLPAFGTLAGSEVGTCQTVPEGVPAGSDTAILNIFGYDPRWSYTGRSVLEAAGVGVTLKKGEVSMRVNLCAVEEMDGKLIIHSHNGGNIEGDEAETLMNDLLKDPRFVPAANKAKLTVHVSRTFRHIGVFADVDETAVFQTTEPHNVLEQDVALYYPTGAMKEEITALMKASYEVLKDHPINKARMAAGKLPANMIWPWGAGRAMLLDNFTEKYGRTGTVISAVPLVWGIAELAGLKHPEVPGANGDLDTNYEGKVDAAVEALKNGDDFAAIHVEAPDEMTHAGKLPEKMEAIKRLDQRVIKPLLEKLPELGDFRILLLSDHKTLMSTRTHDGKPVPYAIYDSRTPGTPSRLDEAT